MLAAKNADIISKVPAPYHAYLDVFSKIKAMTLPLRCTYDHKINLEDGSSPPFSPIYLLSEVGATVLYIIQVGAGVSLYSWLYQNIYRHAGLYLGSLLFAISWMLFCWLIGLFLDKKKIYVRV